VKTSSHSRAQYFRNRIRESEWSGSPSQRKIGFGN
jgi:hypothetical protein